MPLDPSQYAVDGLTPSTVVEPQTEAETAELLARAREAGQAVIPVGGQTMLHVGDIPRRYDIALSTRRLSGIVEYSPGDLTVVVRAGTTMQELQNELAANNQFLPLHPAFPEKATVGGTLAAALSGPWRTAYGSARDFTIGMRMALPSGQVAKSGGKVVKNVAGYDLAKLFIGSYGSLGVITEVAFKVYPLPPQVRRLKISVDAPADVFPLARTILAQCRDMLGLATVINQVGHGGPHFHRLGVIVMLGGNSDRLNELETRVRSACGENTRIDEVGEQEVFLANQAGLVTFRLSTAPRRLDDALSSTFFPFALGYPAVGAAYIYAPDVDAAKIAEIRENLGAHGGNLVLLNASTALKREAGVWGPPLPEMPLMRHVKDVFDPEHVMSPGRFVGDL